MSQMFQPGWVDNYHVYLNHLWNGGNGWGTVKLYDKKDGQLILVDEVEATHIGCEYGEYDDDLH